jgi:hypothetical protein
VSPIKAPALMILEEYGPEERSRFPVFAVLAGILFHVFSSLTTRNTVASAGRQSHVTAVFARSKGVVMPRQPYKRTCGACIEL